MPSQLHEALVLLFRNLPALAPLLAERVLSAPLPKFAEARIESAELTEVQPATYRADLVVLLYDDDKPVFGIRSPWPPRRPAAHWMTTGPCYISTSFALR